MRVEEKKDGETRSKESRTGIEFRSRLGRTGQRMTGQDRTAQDRTGQDRTGQSRTTEDRMRQPALFTTEQYCKS